MNCFNERTACNPGARWWRNPLPLLLAFTLMATGLLSDVLAQSASATYNVGNIPSNDGSYSAACNGPATPLTVTIPAGSDVTSVDVNYSISVQGGAWTNEHRSRLSFLNTSTPEAGPIGGYFDCALSTLCISGAGTSTYTRTGLTIANGITPTGILEFGLEVFHTWPGGSGCGEIYHFVPSGTWTVTVNYSATTPCAGTPTPGNTLSTSSLDCPNTPFALSLQNSTSGSGVSYQWQTSPDNATWTNAGPNNAVWNNPGITADTWFRCEVACTEPGGGIGTSTPVLVEVAPFFNCYCTAGVGPTSGNDSEILAVTLLGTGGDITNSTPCAGQGLGVLGVQNFTAQSANVAPNLSYSLDVLAGQCGAGSFNNVTKAWIDWNQDGIFDEPGERLNVTNGPTSNAGVLYSLNFTVPIGATLGTTGMRVMQRETTNEALVLPCAGYLWGSVHDYSINVVALNCTFPEATATLVEDCPNGQFTIDGNLTSLGDAPSVDIVPSQGAPILGVTSTGPFSLGPYASGSNVSVQVVHNGDALCTISLGSFGDCCSNTALTIDNTLPTGAGNFASFTEAIDFLNAGGACGPVAYTFNVTAGQTFNENPPAVTRSGDAVNPIIFQKAGAGTNPVIVPTGTTALNDFGFGIRGASWITVDGIDVDASASAAVEFGYLIANASATQGSFNNTVRNASIQLDRGNTNTRGVYVSTSTTLSSGFTPSAATGINSDNTLENLTIGNTYYGIYVHSGSTTWPGFGNRVLGCTIGADFIGLPTPDIGGGTSFAVGIYINAQENFELAGNTVRNIASSAGLNRGIYVLNGRGNSDIHGNRVYGVRNTSSTSTTSQRGIDLGTATAGTTVLRVYNNMVAGITAANTSSTTTARVLQGIYISNGGATREYEIDFNSVAIDGSGSPGVSSVCAENISTASIIRWRSNSFSNFTTGQTGTPIHLARRTSGTNTLGAAGSVSDWNNLYIADQANGFIGQTGTTNRALLSDWSTAITVQPGTDLNSVGYPANGIDPFHLDNTSDLHATAPGLVGAAIPGGLAWVTLDFDGDTRLDPSSIGADEYVPASCFPPGNILVSNILPTSADISWDDNGADSYDWEVRSSGAPGSGPVGLEAFGNTIGISVNATGLPDQSTLGVYVLANCPGPIQSAWSSATAFDTPCNIITAPYVMDFEGITTGQVTNAPICWEQLGPDNWLIRQSQFTGFPAPNTDLSGGLALTDNTTGAGSYAWLDGSVPSPTIDDGVNAPNNGLISPLIDISGLTSPYVQMHLASYRVTTPLAENEVKLYAWDGTDWLLISTYNDQSVNAWVEWGNALPPGLPTVTQFRVTVWNVLGSAFNNDILLDDFFVGEAPSCLVPTDVVVDALSTTSADISWNCIGCTGQFYVEYGPPGFTPGTDQNAGTGTVLGPFAGNTATIPGLTANTNYAIRVRQDCGGGLFSNNSTVLGIFTGYCSGGPTSTFDSNLLSVDLIGDSQDISWPVAPATACPAVTQTLDNTALVADVTPTVSYTLNVTMGQCGGGTFSNTLTVYVDWNDNLTFEPSEVIAAVPFQPAPPAGVLVPVNFIVPPGASLGPKRMRVIQHETTLAPPTPPCATYSWGSMHDYTLNVLAAPSCLPPLNLAANNVTENSADIAFTDALGDTYLEYGIAPFTPGTDALAGGGTIVGPVNASPVNLTGLDPNTDYVVYMRQECTPGDWSVNNQVSFTTPCPAVFTAPFTENFEGITTTQENVLAPPCWTKLGGTPWRIRNSQSTAFPAPGWDMPTSGLSNTDNTTGSGSYVWIDASNPVPLDNGTNLPSNQLITPDIDISGLTAPYVEIFVASYRVSTPLAVNALKLYAWDGTDWLLVNTYNDPTVNAWVEWGTVLPPLPAVTRFRLTVWNESGTAFYNDILVDDFSVKEVPACLTPTDLTTTGLSTTSADISWTCVGCTGQFYVEYGPPGFTPGSDQNPGTGTVLGPFAGNSATIGGLSPNTNYAIRVRQDCGLDGFSNNSATLNIFTGYCQGGPTSTGDSNKLGVSLIGATQNIDWPGAGTACPAVTGTLDNTAQVADVIPSLTYNLDVLMGTCSGTWTNSLSAWIDWNQDLQFDPSELVGTAGPISVGTAGTLVSLPFNVPPAATAGLYRLRVMQQETSVFPMNPCATYGFGSMHDYTIEVLPPPSCLPPFDVQVSNVTASSAEVSFTNIVGDVYVEWGPSPFTPGADNNIGGGQFILGPLAASPVALTGLVPTTNYSVYVRQECTPGDWSFNASATFTTPLGCGGTFTDNGGILGNYSTNQNQTWTICPDTPGEVVIVTFNSFQTETNWDGLFIFDGDTPSQANLIPGTNFPGLGSGPIATWITTWGGSPWWGNGFNPLVPAPGPFIATSASGCLTFQFVSDGSVQYPGWEAIIDCVVPPGNVDCSTAQQITCNQLVNSYTLGFTNSLPPTACPFPGAPSTGGSLWFEYTAGATEDITVTTCGLASFNTRLSVFSGPNCTDLTCVSLNEDSPGCSNNSSELTFPAMAGNTYWIVVHGQGSAEGTFDLVLTCAPTCSPAAGNDQCANAATLTPVLNDGLGVPVTGDNTCAYVEQHTVCSGTLPVQGVWYTFNSGPSNLATLTLLDNDEDASYSAADISYALYDGTCLGLLADGPLACGSNAGGDNLLPITSNTNYLLLVYNEGGIGMEGTFGILLTTPPQNDAGLASIDFPVGLQCTTTIEPVVTITNFGEQTLTSLQITYDIDFGTPVVTNWVGSLPYLASTQVTLEPTSVTPGPGLINVSTSLPNGVADEVPANDAASEFFDAAGEAMQMVIQTDNWGAETTWEIYDVFTLPVASGGPYPSDQLITENLCLPTDFGNCFNLVVFDSFGDGMCCGFGNGYWEVRDGDGRLLLRDIFDGDADGDQSPPVSGHITPFYASLPGHPFCLPGGPARILDTECNVFTNNLNNRVYCQTVPGAGQYQFEFLDPDFGYLRRIARPVNNVRLAEISSFPLVPGIVYFARARADQGSPGFFDDDFGVGCEMGLDPTLVPGCTSLIDDPNLPSFSCGVVRQFGGSDRVWAWPVLGGQQYRFRFENVGEGFVRNIIRPSYVCLLNWFTLPLQNGVTYDVTVEVQVNTIWSGFCGSTCQVTIQNPPAMNGTAQRDLSEIDPEVMLWPNPVRGEGFVYLLIDQLEGADQRITVDVYDMSGKRVVAEEFGNSGEVFNTTLEVGHLASGLYNVTITTGERVYTEKLIVQ